ncbi:MAG: DUF6790 family protein [Thermoguttaceae bacterium]|jgi:hypothetical protein
MFACILLAVGLLLSALHLVLFTRDRSATNVARVALVYLLPIAVGLGGLIAFVGHTFRAEEIAKSIGWQPGSPFQFEVAVANLAFGVLGLLCLRFRDGFWIATILGYGVFLEGAAYGHIREILDAGNWAANNAGVILVADIVFPFVLLGLLAVSKKKRRQPKS